ncbi:MAG TPA: FlgO family outer membrane protein, partial [Ottowia sp.]|nr:FlgO family outer membrane protein [Ottowia sp.]
MKKFAPLALSLALASLAGCSSFGEPAPVRRAGPSYESAAQSAFLDSGRAAVGKLVDGLPADTLAGGPVLVATVVNVNNLTRSAPLGRTLSEQYASHM